MAIGVLCFRMVVDRTMYQRSAEDTNSRDINVRALSGTCVDEMSDSDDNHAVQFLFS